MRLKFSSGNLSLGLAATALLAVSTAWALPTHSPSSAASASETAGSGAAWLAGGTARLDHVLDAQKTKQGDGIEAKLQSDVTTPDGTQLPRGTELKGTVTAVNASPNGGPSSISIRFDQAVTRDGKSVPVKVAVIGAYPNDENQLSMYDESSMAPVQKHISLKDRFNQEPGTLHHIAMRTQVSGQNSATFNNQNGNVKLRTGTFFQVGIGSSSASNGNMSAGS